MEPILSVIIPVYNKALFLKRCLNSVAKQMLDTVQVILVDDGSTDGSTGICDIYGRENKWEVYRTKNRGVAAARNFGMSKAKGEYITFLDADDAYTDNALETMTTIARHGFNIIQFGQYRCHTVAPFKDHTVKGHYFPDGLPRRWPMVWNKMYKRSFIKKHKIKFIEGMQFGEDEMFNVQAILANGELYHAPQTLIMHYFDDKKSLCRGELSVERLKGLVDALMDLSEKETDEVKVQWLRNKAKQHEESPLFKKFGYKASSSGRWDIVYFLKEAPQNEELRYSLRSVEKNWQFNKVWFYGGCPDGIKPDHHVHINQTEESKWERVRNMLYKACQNDDITESFWLFNDDFFILQPTPETMAPQYNGTLERQIERVENRHNGLVMDYTQRLRHLQKTLVRAGKPTLNYSVHKPILINRKKMLEVLDKFPDEPMSRALYANYWGVGGEDSSDNKVMVTQFDMYRVARWRFVSTSDDSFNFGNIGNYIRNLFTTKSRFEE